MSKPIISIIVPAYNAEKTIKRTIDSALNQTFSDFELIVVNDGSQDSTLEIVSSIKDPRIKVFSFANAGAAVARNRGFAHSTGEFIAFLDADDLWTPDKLEAQLKALQTNPKAAVAYSWTNYIDESSQFLRQGSYISVEGNIFSDLLLVNFLENGSNPLIRRQAFIEVSGFDESLIASQDFDLYLRLAARYEYIAVPAPQVLYRISNNSMSTNISRLEAAALQVINRAFTQAPDSLQHLKKPSKANLYKYLTYKSLEGIPARGKSLITLKLLWHTVNNDPLLLYRRITWKILLRIMIVFFLPNKLALSVLAMRKQLSNFENLFISK
jgi:glycosyltransferase involved in cell wall biosynthesis